MSNNNSYLTTLNNQLKELEKSIEQTKKLSKDPEMEELAQKELAQLEEQKGVLVESIERIQQVSSEDQPVSGDTPRDVIMEIRAAAGGDEAGLFANDLYRMYLKFAESQGWRTNQLSINEGGIGNIKEVIFEIDANKSKKSPYSLLQFESGAHRVQRIPITESSGRIHTSTATVAVLPKVKEQQVEINPEDLEIDVFRSSGPGGQHANKTESAVRLTHKPTGIITVCQDSRSQLKNRDTALSILRARLYQRQEEEKLAQLGEKRRQQVGTGERSEKIRTYNFPQDRVTDHRIGQSWHQIQKILDGELMPVLKVLNKP